MGSEGTANRTPPSGGGGVGHDWGTGVGEPADATPIRIGYRSTMGDHLRAAAWTGRQSDVLFGVGVASLVAAAGAVFVRDVVLFVVMLVGGVTLITGWFAAPFVWWTVRGQPGLVGSEIEDVIDETGIFERTPRITAHIKWSTYLSAAETREAFYLANKLGTGFLPKRAFDEAELAAFRRLIRQAGLVRGPRRRRRLLTAVAVLLAFLGVALAPIALQRLNVSPRIELAAAIEGSTAHVRGTTDLPDGALLAVEVFHVEGWRAALASGSPVATDSEWVRYRYVEVTEGGFEASFPTTGWPPGRLRAVAFFELALQPSELVERYGPRGEQLAGPNVREDEDGRQVEVWTDLELR